MLIRLCALGGFWSEFSYRLAVNRECVTQGLSNSSKYFKPEISLGLTYKFALVKLQGFFLQFWEGALGSFRLGKLAR